jgi:DNA-binding response OmpR family regulator
MATILIVDDDQLLVRMYQKKLENDGYIVITAEDGVKALEKIAEFIPDLILLDIMMPRLNGLELLKKLKLTEQTKNIPVILLTNVGASEEDSQRGLELGAVAYIVKASNRPAEVVTKIKEILAGYVHEPPQVRSSIQLE